MRLTFAAIVICLSSATLPLLGQKTIKVKAAPRRAQDQIEVVGHIALSGGPVKRFSATNHYSSYYLYVEYESANALTLLDVTRPASPVMLASIPLSAANGASTLFAVAGTSGLIADEQPAAVAPPKPKTIRIMDFSDLKNPKVAREFTGVTAIQRDDRRGLVFVAAGDGLWILQEHLATDPKIDKAYDDYVRYGMSMYPPGK